MMLTPLLALLLQTGPAAAPAPAAVCATVMAPPAGLEAWRKPIDLSGTLGFVVGAAQKVVLGSIDAAKFPLAPSRAPAPGTFGSAFSFSIVKPGTYRIALSAGAWIDVVRDGKSLTSVAHSEGPACSGIRKVVDFDLAAGAHTLELSGAKVTGVTVLVAPK